jgi:hypothetical protein
MYAVYFNNGLIGINGGILQFKGAAGEKHHSNENQGKQNFLTQGHSTPIM